MVVFSALEVSADCTSGCDACEVVQKWLHFDKETETTNNEYDIDPAPPDWSSYPGSGTPSRGVDYLYCWYSSEYPNLADVGLFAVSLVTDFLDNDQFQSILDMCSTIKDDPSKALCAAHGVHSAFQGDEDMVCRHHALALESVLESLDIPAQVEAAIKTRITKIEGHAWVSIHLSDHKECLLDAYNDYYACYST